MFRIDESEVQKKSKNRLSGSHDWTASNQLLQVLNAHEKRGGTMIIKKPGLKSVDDFPVVNEKTAKKEPVKNSTPTTTYDEEN